MTPGLPHAVSYARHKPAPLFEALTLLRQDFAADQTARHLVMEHAHNPKTKMLIGESVLFSIFPVRANRAACQHRQSAKQLSHASSAMPKDCVSRRLTCCKSRTTVCIQGYILC